MAGRFENVGTLAPGGIFLGAAKLTTTPFNPEGDWGAIYFLAHPRSDSVPSTQLRTDLHGKDRDPADNRWEYFFRVRNVGSSTTSFDVDWYP
jgi:hypothetical protein